MFEGLTEENLGAALEALLFVSDEPVSVLTLAQVLQVEVSEATAALDALAQRLELARGGVRLREVAGGWRLFTAAEYGALIQQYMASWETRKLTSAALETLAIVAYGQPITRAGIASIRGVNSDSSINSLLDKGLLREAGVADTAGNPVLYATSRAFLQRFGLKSVDDLPPLADFAPDEETRKLILERLGAAPEYRLQENSAPRAADAAAAFDAVALADDFAPAAQEGLASADAQRALLQQAMAQAVGAVEKIDFDALSFEFDDE